MRGRFKKKKSDEGLAGNDRETNVCMLCSSRIFF